MSEEEYKNYYEMKGTFTSYIQEKKDSLMKKSNHKYPNGDKYITNWKLNDIVTIDKLKNVKGICIQCKKPNIKYIDKNEKLQAICDNCGFNLTVNLPDVEQYHSLVEKLTTQIEDIKNDIVRWKLNLLFKLDDEDVVLKEFQQLKSDLEYNTKLLKTIKKQHLKKDALTIEEQGENLPITRKNLIKKYEKNIISQKEEYKDILKKIIKNNSNDNSMQDAMILHQQIMKDIQKKREMEFELGNIEMIPILDDKGEIEKFVMHKKEKNYENLEHGIDEKENTQTQEDEKIRAETAAAAKVDEDALVVESPF